MKKTNMLAAAVITAAMASQASAIGVGTFDASGVKTGQNVQSSGTVTLVHTPVDHPFSGQWNFVDNGNGTADFSGNLYFGDFDTYTKVSVAFLGSMTGTVKAYGAEHTIGGTGTWDGTNFSFTVPTGGPNSGAASSYTSSAPSTCTGSGSIAGNTVCGTAGNTTPEYEGLVLSLVFSGDLSSFTGTLRTIEKSGSGLTANTTTFDYAVNGVAAVPVPAAAWLFGSGLIGLSAVARRRRAASAS